jgi:hypothetical protein
MHHKATQLRADYLFALFERRQGWLAVFCKYNEQDFVYLVARAHNLPCPEAIKLIETTLKDIEGRMQILDKFLIDLAEKLIILEDNGADLEPTRKLHTFRAHQIGDEEV